MVMTSVGAELQIVMKYAYNRASFDGHLFSESWVNESINFIQGSSTLLSLNDDMSPYLSCHGM